jgi:hypothetical protein
MTKGQALIEAGKLSTQLHVTLFGVDTTVETDALCADCLKLRAECLCERCATCDALSDYCECNAPHVCPGCYDVNGERCAEHCPDAAIADALAERYDCDPIDFDDDSDDLTDKEDPSWE